VYAGKRKPANSLVPFWKRLRRNRGQIRVVAMDMSVAYISAGEKTYLTRRLSSTAFML